MKFPSKSVEREQRRKDREFEEAARRERYESRDKEQNWQREAHLKAVRGLPDTDEHLSVIADALRYLLERASD